MSNKSNPLVKQSRERKRLQLHFNDDGLTQQHFQDETDINNIMAKFAKTGLVDHVNNIQGAYGDFTTVQDYQLHLDQVMAADAAFMALPSSIRRRFDNDPSHLLAFIADPRNRQEAIDLGLISPPPPQPSSEPKARAEGTHSGGSGGEAP
ncbi:internal scaffolding protein [Blackfly microvirus SF02]|uniref:Internal scaffolding protein n=1 Tax=Blackfly microvirus SF02 TaxID=2576452 RepID=A0A4P8PL12_9VIRU|nr:internal scaffolding protein [Blackfly microvirus SF02]